MYGSLSLVKDGLEINSKTDAHRILLTWTGEVSMRDPAEVLLPFLQYVLQTAKDRELALVLDFSRLDFMNSSSLVPVVEVVRLMVAEGVLGRLVYRKSVSWQRVSYQCMKVLAKAENCVTVVYAEDDVS